MVFSEFSFKEIIKYTYIYPIPFQLWYISSLIKCVIISPLIYFAIKSVGIVSGPILFLLWFFNILEYPIALFSIWAYIAIKKITFNRNIKKSKYITILILFIITTLISTYLLYFDLPYLDIMNNLVRLLGIISIWIGYDQYCDKWNKNFDITKYGIFIYLFHEPLQSFIVKIMLKLLNNLSFKHILTYLVSPKLVIIISIIIANFLDTYMNKL